MTNNEMSVDFGLEVSNQSVRNADNLAESIAEMADRSAELQNSLAEAFGNTKTVLKWAATIYTVKRGFQELFQAGEALDTMLAKSRITFNGYTNALAAYEKFQGEVMAGNLVGSAESYMQAAELLHQKGIKMTDRTTQVLENWAQAAGTNVTDVAQAINSAVEGNTSAFEKFGITERTMKRFRMYAAGTTQMRDAVMNFVKAQTQFNDAASKAPLTWENILNRIRTFKDRFLEAIIGRANDPNSLNATVKRVVTDVLDFLYQSKDFFKAVAGTISAVLKWFVKQIGEFVQYVIGGAKKSIDSLSNFTDNWKKRVAGFILWLELIKLKIVDWYKKHEEVILKLLKWFVIFKAAQLALAIPVAVINSVIAFAAKWWDLLVVLYRSHTVQFVIGFIEGIAQALVGALVPGIDATKLSFLKLTAVLLTNPFVLVGTAIALLVVGLILLNKKHKEWSDWLNKVPTKIKAVLSSAFPFLIFVEELVHKFEKLKASVQNFGTTIKNVFAIAGEIIKTKAAEIKQAFIDMLPDWGQQILQSLNNVTEAVKWWFSNMAPDWVKDLVSVAKNFDKVFSAQGLYTLGRGIVGGGINGLNDWTTKSAAISGQAAEDIVPNYTAPAVQMADKDGGNFPLRPEDVPTMQTVPTVTAKREGTKTVDNSVKIDSVIINGTDLKEEQLTRAMHDYTKKVQRDSALKGK